MSNRTGPQRKPHDRRVLLLMLGLGLAAGGLLTGCGGAKPSSDRSAEDAQEDPHDHLHDHGIPAHKPASFAVAVARLQRRLPGLKPPSTNLSPRRWQQFGDIVRWLPELAGDTDLKRAEWDQVQGLTRELEQELARWQAGQSPAIQPLLDRLQPLAEQTAEQAP